MAVPVHKREGIADGLSMSRHRWKRRAAILLSVACLVFSGGSISAESSGDNCKTAHFPSLISCLRTSDRLDFCGEPAPLDSQEVRERLEKEFLLSLWNRAQVILWLKRTTRYFPIIEELLARNSMPDDLKYVAVAESALRPHAVSSSGAVGFWQFMKHTGMKYALEITSDIDERRNIFASTRAALRFLKESHDELGSWT
ncbi:lytic transglycosylase domain-containing protein, partial [Thermodesulfobacteriota bacterium]